MENAIVTFKSKDTGKEINITLSYDKETSNLDYNVQLGTEYSSTTKMDFIGFLANMFLNCLQIEDK